MPTPRRVTTGLALAAVALTKGPDLATVFGPGPARPITIRGLGKPGGVSPLTRLVHGE